MANEFVEALATQVSNLMKGRNYDFLRACREACDSHGADWNTYFRAISLELNRRKGYKAAAMRRADQLSARPNTRFKNGNRLF